MAHTAGTQLHKGLKQRHLTMIAIGGVIGAGLFVGSGVVINRPGPGAFLTYASTGVLIVWSCGCSARWRPPIPRRIVRRLRPAGAGRLGRLLGRLAVLVFLGDRRRLRGGRRRGHPAEMAARRAVVDHVAGLLLLMTATNLYSVRSYGEFEYWFAGIKVAAICVFLVLGALYVLGLWPGKGMDFSNLTAHGGFFPNGFGASSPASWWSSSRWSAPRSPPSRPPNPPSRSAPSSGRPTP